MNGKLVGALALTASAPTLLPVMFQEPGAGTVQVAPPAGDAAIDRPSILAALEHAWPGDTREPTVIRDNTVVVRRVAFLPPWILTGDDR